MPSLRLSELVQPLPARLVGKDVAFGSVSTDTRSLNPGDLYVALSGPRFDGHAFVSEAESKGAVAVLVSREVETRLPQLVCADTRLGLGRLAGFWRESVDAPLVAITGSNGKTTVKELLTAILAQRGPVLATRGNLNNDIGMPLTLLRWQEEYCAVLEMGANHPGEIGYLSQIARPDVALITNAGAAHLEGFGDLDGVAHAKGEILGGLRHDGVAVLNADDPYFALWREMLGERRMVSFGVSPRALVQADLDAAEMTWTPQGFHNRMQVQVQETRFEVQLALVGRHNLMNALAAIAAAWALSCSVEQIQNGLVSTPAVRGRLQILAGRNGYRLIDDSYNANPNSVGAAIEVLRSAPGRRYLVLGDLAELGDEARMLHEKIGHQARQAGIEHLFTLGPLSRTAAEGFGDGARGFSDIDDLIAALRGLPQPGDAVLVKGSRSAGMERVVQGLLAEGEADRAVVSD
ncbi:MAG: UDP-N-acetylmuramoyl-tripeptide--D-alanyl-D-alanine ligase [Candidatus Thiodiazotropha sp.]